MAGKLVRRAAANPNVQEYVEHLESSNAELLEALENAQVSALKLAHMVFVCFAYAGRMNDIRYEVDLLRVNVTAAIEKEWAE